MATRRAFNYHRRTIEDVRRILSRTTPAEYWQEVENELGPLDRITDDDVRQRLSHRQRVAEIVGDPRLAAVPPVIAARVLSTLIDKARRSARSVEDRRAITEANRLLGNFAASLPRRPKHRPRKHYAERIGQAEAVREFKLLRSALVREGYSWDEATVEAAKLIAPSYRARPATLISWAANPGRRGVKRLRRPQV